MRALLLIACLGLPLVAQSRILEQAEPARGLLGAVRFTALVDGEPRGSFAQTVSADSVGFLVSEELVLRYGEDKSEDVNETWLDPRLRLLRRTRQIGTRMTEWRREGELFLRETSFPSISEAKNLEEFDRPPNDVVYGFGHFLLIVRSLPLEMLDGHTFSKLERDGPITVDIRRMQDGRVEYREVYHDGAQQRMWIELDDAGKPWRITSPDLVFDFVREDP